MDDEHAQLAEHFLNRAHTAHVREEAMMWAQIAQVHATLHLADQTAWVARETADTAEAVREYTRWH